MKDYIDGKVTIGIIDNIVFNFKSGKKCVVEFDEFGSWSQDIRESKVLIDPDVIDAVRDELVEQGYFKKESDESE